MQKKAWGMADTEGLSGTTFCVVGLEHLRMFVHLIAGPSCIHGGAPMCAMTRDYIVVCPLCVRVSATMALGNASGDWTGCKWLL